MKKKLCAKYKKSIGIITTEWVSTCSFIQTGLVIIPAQIVLSNIYVLNQLTINYTVTNSFYEVKWISELAM